MQTISAGLTNYRYLVQIVLVAAMASAATYVSVMLLTPPTPWNALWMMAIPVIFGLAVNKGVARIIMAVMLLIVSLVACAIVGNAMGGI